MPDKKITTQRFEEQQFLPAALEIVETPPLPMSRYILWSIMLFFSIGVVWATVGEVDIVGVAQGKIVPSGNVKVIQPLETGVVKEILVTEGQYVESGDALIKLDTTVNQADVTQNKEQYLALLLDRARINSVLNGIENKGDNSGIENIEGTNSLQLQILKQRIDKDVNEYHARIQSLKDEIHQRSAEREAIRQRISQIEAVIPLITERAKSLKDMSEKNMAPRVQWLELEQERVEQTREKDIQTSNLESLNASINNIKQRIQVQEAEYQKQLLSELADAELRITALEQEIIKAEQRMHLQTLNAPVSGRVHQLAIHTKGGVVTPAQELMRIVPKEDAMEIEAWVSNKDIGFVNEGQEAEIKVETFAFTKYGTIDGEIKTLSNDATADENLGLVYATRVSMDKTTMHIKDKIVNLTPGMAVTVEVNMGKRRLIEYLLTPLLRYRDESVRER